MIATWYGIVSFMLTVYVALDGRNFGAGMLHWFIARTPEERRQVVAAIGPLWSWHEVWLVGFCGGLVAGFSPVKASGFSGLLLWLLFILLGPVLCGGFPGGCGPFQERLLRGVWDF